MFLLDAKVAWLSLSKSLYDFDAKIVNKNLDI